MHLGFTTDPQSLGIELRRVLSAPRQHGGLNHAAQMARKQAAYGAGPNDAGALYFSHAPGPHPRFPIIAFLSPRSHHRFCGTRFICD
jgi:hypothetical protein